MKQYILVLLLLGIIVINSGCTQPPQEPVSPNTTYSPNLTQTNAIPSSVPPNVKDTNIPLFVYSKPVGASIFLDGTDTGLQSIGLLKNVSTGSHTIVLKLDGYYDSMREAHPIPQGANTLNIPLIRIPNGSITVNSDPAGAAIYFDDTFTGKTTNDTLMGIVPGSHHITVHRDGYSESEQQVSLISGQNVNITLPLKKIPEAYGNVSVTSYPKRIEIYLDGVTTGQMTNSVLNAVPVGLHTISLRNPGYTDVDQLVRVIPNQTVDVYAERFQVPEENTQAVPVPAGTPIFTNGIDDGKIPTGIFLNTSPMGAAIYLGGKDTGRSTPSMLKGDYWWADIVYHLDGYYDSSHTVTTRPGSTIDLSTQLTKATKGSVSVVSNPPGARIFVDGVDTGKITNCIVNSISPGPHTITLSLPGYYPASQEVVIAEGQTVYDYTPLVVDPDSPDRPKPPTPVPTYAQSSAREKVTLDIAYPEFPRTLMAYKVLHEDPDVKMADLMKKFDIYGDLKIDDERIVVQELNSSSHKVSRELALYLASGSFEYTDWTRYMGEDPRDLPEFEPDKDEARSIALEYLKNKDLLHEGIGFEESFKGTEESNSGSGNHTIIHQDIFLVFNRSINGSKSTDQIRVTMGGGGDILQLEENWKKIELYKEFPLISPQEAFKELQDSGMVGNVTDISLEYYSGSRFKSTQYILPVYVFRGTMWGKCSYQPFTSYVSAAPILGRSGVIQEPL